MNRNRAIITKITTLCLILSATLATGCEPLRWFGPNFTLTNVIPIGLGGSPGLLNPFGIVQAFVNSAIGAGSTTDGEEDGGTSSAAGSAVPAGAIGSVITSPNDTSQYDPTPNTPIN